ncbi:MAG: hypothetical protein ABIK43_03595 [candidate division WOR-3 bacterium]
MAYRMNLGVTLRAAARMAGRMAGRAALGAGDPAARGITGGIRRPSCFHIGFKVKHIDLNPVT